MPCSHLNKRLKSKLSRPLSRVLCSLSPAKSQELPQRLLPRRNRWSAGNSAGSTRRGNWQRLWASAPGGPDKKLKEKEDSAICAPSAEGDWRGQSGSQGKGRITGSIKSERRRSLLADPSYFFGCRDADDSGGGRLQNTEYVRKMLVLEKNAVVNRFKTTMEAMEGSAKLEDHLRCKLAAKELKSCGEKSRASTKQQREGKRKAPDDRQQIATGTPQRQITLIWTNDLFCVTFK